MGAPERNEPELQHHDAEIQGPLGKIRLHVVTAGPENGPLIVLLHGFPEFWFCWRKQIGPLVRAGFRVLVPDQRGYGWSDKPASVREYGGAHLASDVLGLIRWAGRERATIAGHDWGGASAWMTAILYPEAVEQLIILNCPHPVAMERRMYRNPLQAWKAVHMLLFQVPFVPETVFKLTGYRLVSDGMKRTALAGTFTDADLARYVEAWSQPRAMKSMIDWYRAIFRGGEARTYGAKGKVKVPTTLIWGKKDAFLQPVLARESAALCESARVEYVEATHWVNQDRPEEVSALMIAAARGALGREARA